MTPRAFSAVPLFAACVLASCGGSMDSAAQAGKYDEQCGSDQDRVLVDVGICNCSCPMDVVGVAEVPKLESHASGCGSARGACSPVLAKPLCNAGTCAAALPNDAGADGEGLDSHAEHRTVATQPEHAGHFPS